MQGGGERRTRVSHKFWKRIIPKGKHITSSCCCLWREAAASPSLCLSPSLLLPQGEWENGLGAPQACWLERTSGDIQPSLKNKWDKMQLGPSTLRLPESWGPPWMVLPQPLWEDSPSLFCWRECSLTTGDVLGSGAWYVLCHQWAACGGGGGD